MTPDDTIFAPMPELREPMLYGWRLVFIPFYVSLGGYLLVHIDPPWVVGIPCFMVLLIYAWRRERPRTYRKRAREMPQLDDRARSASELVFTLELERARRFRWQPEAWSWAQFEEQRRLCGLPPVRAIVEKALEPAVGSIDCPDALLEPEPVASSLRTSRRGALAFGGFFLAISLLGAVQGNWQGAGLALLMVLVILGQMPQFRDFHPFALGRTQVASVGGVLASDGRRWTPDDAVLLVSGRGRRGPVLVRLVGPAGWLSMCFMSPDEADFVTLWQRWMHPAPRPELLEPS